MAIYRGPGGPGDATADSASTAQLAQTYATQAAASAAAAATSATSASTSSTSSSSSATAAAASATAAASSAASAASSETAAATSATSAAASASSALTSAGNASTSETAAETAQTAAETAQAAAETAQAAAEAAEAGVAASASAAATSSSNAASSATAAANSATAAATSATAAAASETAAAGSATDAASSASSASSSASSAASSASAASTSATAAATSATAAQTAQTAAETAQTAAETAQAAAETAQGAAETAQTGAETAETGAVAAQTAAEAARDATLAAYDSFDDRYLGVKTSDPTLDNDGNALIAGALYFNSTDEKMRLYTGSAWVDAYVTGAGFLTIANNLSDLASASTARTNLGLGTAATTAATDYATSAQGALADSATQPGDNVSTLTNDAGYLTFVDNSNIDSTAVTAGYVLSANGTGGTVWAAETDPVYVASSWYTTTNNAANWDTAYGWGNHASAGYLTSETYTGTVTSVDMTVPTGLSISGNPVTSTGTLAVSYATGYSIPTNTSQGNWNDAYTWVAAFPSQTGNSGKVLTTDGSSLSWSSVDADPAGTAVALAIALG